MNASPPRVPVSRQRLAALLTAGLIVILTVWAWAWLSEVDNDRCSAQWKTRVLCEKLSGHLSFVGWTEMPRNLLAACYDRLKPHPLDRTHLLEERLLNGRKCELYQTELGRFWLPAPGKFLITYLVWEIAAQHDYESGDVAVRPGDTVIDCGAHVGVYCRYALRHGAARVVAVEPDPANLACLELNFAPEIARGQVIVVKAGVWNRRTHLPLFQAQEDNSGGHSFLTVNPREGSRVEGLLVLPLDEIVQELRLDRVDFIKMDIEGSERFALQGAAQTLGRFRPRMAICAYHLLDDPRVIPEVVRKAQPSYRIYAKDVEIIDRRVATKVLFFN